MKSITALVWIAAIASIACAGICRAGAAPARVENLLKNGDLAIAEHGLPAGWRTSTFMGCASAFRWLRSSGAAAAIELVNRAPAAAALEQDVNLVPGWYRLDAEMRVEDIAERGAGAQLCLRYGVSEFELCTPALSVSAPWRRDGFYLKVGRKSGKFAISCQLGGKQRPVTGRGYFRDVVLSKQEPDPTRGGARFDLDLLWGPLFAKPATIGWIPQTFAPQPVGRPWTVPLTFAIIALGILVGWRLLAAPVPR
jgi:hypothetical protein